MRSLRAFLLAFDTDAGWSVNNPYRRFQLIYILSARSTSSHRRSLGFRLISRSSAHGTTETMAGHLWVRLDLSVFGIRWTRWTPFLYSSVANASPPLTILLACDEPPSTDTSSSNRLNSKKNHIHAVQFSGILSGLFCCRLWPERQRKT